MEAIWERAKESIGCEVGERVAFEAKVMVEGLRQIREVIEATGDRIEEICKGFKEYPYLLSIPGFGPEIFIEGVRSHRRSLSVSRRANK